MKNIASGYWEEKVRDNLEDQGLSLGDTPTELEVQLMQRLLIVSGAAESVLSDLDDDGVAEAHDMAVLGLRNALVGARLSDLDWNLHSGDV